MKTPDEYVADGNDADAIECMKRIYKTENFTEIKVYYDQIKHNNELLAKKENVEGNKVSEELSIAEMFKQWKYAKIVLIGCTVSAIQQLSGINVFVTASNQLFAQAGVSPKLITLMSTVMTLLNVIMTFPAMWLIELLGRKQLMVYGIAGQTIGALLPTIAEWVEFDDNSNAGVILSIVGIYLLVCCFAASMGPVL